MSPDDLVKVRLAPFSFPGPIPEAEQDDLRDAMILDAKKMPKFEWSQYCASDASRRGAAAMTARAKELRAKLEPEIIRLKGKGLSNRAIARIVEKSPAYVNTIIKES